MAVLLAQWTMVHIIHSRCYGFKSGSQPLSHDLLFLSLPSFLLLKIKEQVELYLKMT